MWIAADEWDLGPRGEKGCFCTKLIQLLNEGVRVHHIRAPALNLPFREALFLAGPNTKLPVDPRDYPDQIIVDPFIWHAEEVVKAREMQEEEGEFILLNFPRAWVAGPHVVEKASRLGLRTTNFYDVCAIAAHDPSLFRTLASDPCYLISTQDYEIHGIRRACCAITSSAIREVSFVPFCYPLHDSYWFAFKSNDPKGGNHV